MREIIGVHVASVHHEMDTEVSGRESHAVISGDMASIGRIEATFFLLNLKLKTKSRGIKLNQISKEMLPSCGSGRAAFPKIRYRIGSFPQLWSEQRCR